MKGLTGLLCIFIMICFCSMSFATELDPAKFMTIDKIKPGMKGTGKTVFTGTKIEEFQIEVLDVAKNVAGPKADIIWVMCSGGPLKETGVISGMSGSPVYIDGKLIGAISYRAGSFVKQPIAGVTPIADMLEIMERKAVGHSGQSGLSEWDFPFPLQGKDAYSLKLAGQSEENPSSLMPIQTPVMISGFNARTIEYITPVLKNFGMIPLQGGGTSYQAQSEDVKLEPGAVFGVEFIRGDAIAFASGTVTYVEGDKVLAFGHPMYGMGETSLPASIGKITLLVPSLLSSSKIGSPVKTIGTLIQDRPYGVMSVTSKQPEFIPMKIKLKSQQDTNTREFNFEIAKHRLFSPMFIFSVAMDTIVGAEKMIGDYTMKTHSEIKLKGYPVISKDNVFSGMSPDMVAEEFAAPLYLLMLNRFEEVNVENISLEILFEDKRTNALIDSIRINKDLVKPGDVVEVTAFMTPYMQDTISIKFEVTIPKDIPEGRALLRISDAISNESWERARAPMKSRVTDVSQIIQQIQEEESNNNIIVELFSPKAGVTIRGEELPALPLTAFSIINSSKQMGGSGPTMGTTFLKQRIHTDYVISGSAALPLIIDRDAP